MKKRIFRDFAIVISLALIIGCTLLYFMMSSILLETEKDNLMTTLKTLDYASADILENEAVLENFIRDEDERFTVIDRSGEVLLDSGTAPEMMENHLERIEVKEALKNGVGSDIRFSKTQKEDLLYVAYYNEDAHQIYRIATPYHGLAAYGYVLLPLLVVIIGICFVLSLWMARRFSDSLAKPLEEITEEIRKISNRNETLQFPNYRYAELKAITDTLTQLQGELGETMDRLEQEKQIRTEFFSNASHELKTPLTSIRGYAELLNSGMVEEAQKEQCLNRILLESDHMIELINDILMISRLEGKQVDSLASTFELSELIQDLVDSQMPNALQSDIRIHVSLHPMTVYASKRHMKELIGNLLRNALKYNRPHGQIEIELCEEGGLVKIVVEDSGIGIAPENQLRIFERFYRVDEGRDKKIGGSGLGLAIVKHIVNYYNGLIQLDSKVGVGTRIIVLLPIKQR